LALRLRPVEGGFYGRFVEASRHLVSGAALLAEVFADGVDRAVAAGRMREAEQAADETTEAIVAAVTHSFVTPFDREDAYALAIALDEVVDRMHTVAELVVLLDSPLPRWLHEQVDLVIQGADVVARAMAHLRTPAGLTSYWIEMHRLENAGDALHRRNLATVLGGGFEALEAMRLKELTDRLEDTVDAFAEVASVLELVAVKGS